MPSSPPCSCTFLGSSPVGPGGAGPAQTSLGERGRGTASGDIPDWTTGRCPRPPPRPGLAGPGSDLPASSPSLTSLPRRSRRGGRGGREGLTGQEQSLRKQKLRPGRCGSTLRLHPPPSRHPHPRSGLAPTSATGARTFLPCSLCRSCLVPLVSTVTLFDGPPPSPTFQVGGPFRSGACFRAEIFVSSLTVTPNLRNSMEIKVNTDSI